LQTNRNLVLTMAVLIVISFVLLSKIGDLSREVESLSRNYQGLQSEIGSLSGNVSQQLDHFTREQSWITPVQVNESKTISEQQGLEAVLNWQIKDLPAGAEVIFHYSESESEDFKSIAPESKNTGFYEVTVPLTVEAEPYWGVSLNITRSRGRGVSESTVMREDLPSQQTFSCYVSMKVDGDIRCSEVTHLNLDYLSHVKYESIHGHIDVKNNKYEIVIPEHFPDSNGIESVLAKFYDGNKVVYEKPLEEQEREGGRKDYSLSHDAGSENVTRLQLQVKYQNGKTFTKEFFLG
jgi:hypothetical protein